MMQKGRHVPLAGERNGMARTSLATVLAVRSDYTAAKSSGQKIPAGFLAKLAAKHEITRNNVAKIVYRHRWKSV